jgi:hypothetical protein
VFELTKIETMAISIKEKKEAAAKKKKLLKMLEVRLEQLYIRYMDADGKEREQLSNEIHALGVRISNLERNESAQGESSGLREVATMSLFANRI